MDPDMDRFTRDASGAEGQGGTGRNTAEESSYRGAQAGPGMLVRVIPMADSQCNVYNAPGYTTTRREQ